MGRFLERWPSLERAALRSPIVRACASLADRGVRDDEALAAALVAIEDELRVTREKYLEISMKLPPAPFAVGDQVFEYIGPCAICGRGRR